MLVCNQVMATTFYANLKVISKIGLFLECLLRHLAYEKRRDFVVVLDLASFLHVRHF